MVEVVGSNPIVPTINILNIRMPKITLTDGYVKDISENTTLYEVAKDISNSLAKNAVAGKINGELKDLSVIIENDCDIEIIKKTDDEGIDIEAACGGCCACATCHVYIDDKWMHKLDPIDDDEESMLDQAFDVKNNSRLSCQIQLNDELDGLELELAPE